MLHQVSVQVLVLVRPRMLVLHQVPVQVPVQARVQARPRMLVLQQVRAQELPQFQTRMTEFQPVYLWRLQLHQTRIHLSNLLGQVSER